MYINTNPAQFLMDISLTHIWTPVLLFFQFGDSIDLRIKRHAIDFVCCLCFVAVCSFVSALSVCVDLFVEAKML